MREIKIQVLFKAYEKDFSEKVLEHYTTFDRLIDGRDTFDYKNAEIIAKRQFTGLKDKNGKEIYEKMEIDNKFIVDNDGVDYVLSDISNGDIIRLSDYYRFKNGKIEITKEYTEV